MDAHKFLFTQFITGCKQFMVPVFQRDFSWSIEQCQQLWSDITEASTSNTDSGHFMGSIVYIESSQTQASVPIWLLIDGQQRITTLTLAMVALRDHIKATNWSGSDEGPNSAKIESYYLKNEHEVGERQFKLLLRDKDNATLRALVSGNNFELGIEYSELLIDAYDYFYSELQKPNCDPEDIFLGITRLNIVAIRLDRGVDNPQLVYESMNSTGVDLRPSDLVRNYLLMGLDEIEQSRLYNEYWKNIETMFRSSEIAFDNFLREYIALVQHRTNQVQENRIYEEFKSFYKNLKVWSLEELLADMVRVARHYASFLGVETSQYTWLNDVMSNMRGALHKTQVLLVMRLFDLHERELVSKDEFVRAIELIESYLVRRAVLNLQSRGYWSIFTRVAREIDFDSDKSVFESLQINFALLQDSYHFPSDEEFRTGLQEYDIYGKRICRHLLNRLENAKSKEPSPVNNYSIEHIMPQNIKNSKEWQETLGNNWFETHAIWVHRLGNLTLTAYNSKYSNRSFDEKKVIDGGFKQSAVRLNEDVKDKEEWSVSEMQERGRRLAVKSLAVWQHHGTNPNIIRDAEIRDLKKRASSKEVSDLEIEVEVQQIFQEIRSCICSLTDVIEIVEEKSVCYLNPEIFAELIPMKRAVNLMLPLDFNEIENPNELDVRDTSTWKFVRHRVHASSNLLVKVWTIEDVKFLRPLILQALDQSF